MHFNVPIIPSKVEFSPLEVTGNYNLRAIAAFCAIGFFLEKETYYKEQIALQPATNYELDATGKVISENKHWQWHYNPREINLKQATEEFAHLFERIVHEQTADSKVILPLSGGLDSRTLAAALKGNCNVNSYSYEFRNGYRETRIAQKIAQKMEFNFSEFTITEGYLWNEIDAIAKINGCYADFTNPRQAAFIKEYKNLGNLFLLGHWGDVLFDNMAVPENMTIEHQVALLMKKVVKKGGLELATALWNAWNLPGSFKNYLTEQLTKLLGDINIDNANSRLRAFKSLYWAPRWTSVNMAIFSSVHPIAVPYYHDDMCKFICTIPEQLLAGRQIQIEYLKMKTPELASISWQAHKPFNLYNYKLNRSPWNLPYKIWNKSRNTIRTWTGNQLVQRNWELQFTGKQNDLQLRNLLFDNSSSDILVPKEIRQHFYDQFLTGNKVYWSHPLSMLLTLSMFCKINS